MSYLMWGELWLGLGLGIRVTVRARTTVPDDFVQAPQSKHGVSAVPFAVVCLHLFPFRLVVFNEGVHRG